MDEARLACAIKDLQSVPLSSELSESLRAEKGKVKVIIAQLDEATNDPEANQQSKQEATKIAETTMQPILVQLKEAVRRIRVA